MAEKAKKKWIKAAIGEHKGVFGNKAKAAGESTSAYASEHEHDSGKLGREARLAKTLMSMHHKRTTSHKTIRHSMYGDKE